MEATPVDHPALLDRILAEDLFETCFGFKPKQDDMHRVSCRRGGELGHFLCGVCAACHKPRFVCGHLKRQEPAQSFITRRAEAPLTEAAWRYQYFARIKAWFEEQWQGDHYAVFVNEQDPESYYSDDPTDLYLQVQVEDDRGNGFELTEDRRHALNSLLGPYWSVRVMTAESFHADDHPDGAYGLPGTTMLIKACVERPGAG